MLNNLKSVNEDNKRLLAENERYKDMQGSFNKAILVQESFFLFVVKGTI